MRNTLTHVVTFVLMLLLLSMSFYNALALGTSDNRIALETLANQSDPVIQPQPPQPMYVRLQAQEDSNVTLWESIPQNLSDHIATIGVNALAVFVSSNAQKTDVYEDNVGNLWLIVNYQLKKGDYITTLAWISSETLSQNLTIPDSLSFPQNYPDDVQPFLLPGTKIPADNATIKQLAEENSSQNMIQTVENILNFVNETQTYDLEKVRLLMNGTLSTASILDFINDPSQSLNQNRSFCFERSLLATTMLRAVGVPARTFTNLDLKTWIQVWLPHVGWVDGDVLSIQPQPQPLFPRSLSVSVPRMVENSSDATFPITWLPKTQMRVANLTLTSLGEFDINQYGTLLCQPTDIDAYESNPNEFSFPILFEPQTVQAALTSNSSDIIFHLSNGEENASMKLNLGVVNHIQFEDLSVSFKPARQSDTVVALNNFSVQKIRTFDYRILIPLIAAVPVLLIFTYYWRRKRVKTSSLHDHGNLISSEKS